jgi:hypothetical protein
MRKIAFHLVRFALWGVLYPLHNRLVAWEAKLHVRPIGAYRPDKPILPCDDRMWDAPHYWGV